MVNVLICGIGGKMGANVLSIVNDDKDSTAVCGVDIYAPQNISAPVYDSFDKVQEKVDVVIDFSSPKSLPSLLQFAKMNKCAVVLATTGYSPDDLAAIDEASKEIAVFKTANFSVGVNLLVKLVNEAAAFLGEQFDVEIVEAHHKLKVDAPSGTALMLADSVNKAFGGTREYMDGRSGIVGKRGNEIGMHAVRGGTVVGEHEVMFLGEDEEITFKHKATSKKVFASGAVKAAKFVAGKPAGKYDMTDVLKNL